MSKLLTASTCTDEYHLIIDDSEHLSNLVLNRVNAIIESGAKPILISEKLCISSINSILFEKEIGELDIISKEFELDDLEKFGRLEVNCVVDRVFVTLTEDSSNAGLKQKIYERCKRLRVPVNTNSSNALSTFTMLSTFKKGEHFQFGLTVSNQSCKLTNRLKREIIQKLPNDLENIIKNIGDLKERIKFKENENTLNNEDNSNIDNNDTNLKRSRWLSQIIEYYPLNKLSEISINDLTDAYFEPTSITQNNKRLKLNKKGRISLIGSGPGSLSMLTIGALNEIYNADLVLADKLVPQQILDIIPKKTEIFIARKFPGNADAAQQELLDIGLKNLNDGKNIVRLKQGDPFIFGRGGEEYLFFESNGFKPIILPGLTSALVSPIVASIPTTHRDVSDQVLICTGTGKKGKLGSLPSFEPKRTTVFLMTLKKIVDVLPELYKLEWPTDLPICIIERASCPDQRLVRTTLGNLIDVLKIIDSRPPGLLVTGYSCEVLCKLGPDEKYRVEDGYFENSEDSEDKSSYFMNRGLNKIVSRLTGQFNNDSICTSEQKIGLINGGESIGSHVVGA